MYTPERRHANRDRIIDCEVKKLELREKRVRPDERSHQSLISRPDDRR
jgi:hypothetical protein